MCFLFLSLCCLVQWYVYNNVNKLLACLCSSSVFIYRQGIVGTRRTSRKSNPFCLFCLLDMMSKHLKSTNVSQVLIYDLWRGSLKSKNDFWFDLSKYINKMYFIFFWFYTNGVYINIYWLVGWCFSPSNYLFIISWRKQTNCLVFFWRSWYQSCITAIYIILQLCRPAMNVRYIMEVPESISKLTLY